MTISSRVGYDTVLHVLQTSIRDYEILVTGEKPVQVEAHSILHTRAWIAGSHPSVYDVAVQPVDSNRVSVLVTIGDITDSSDVEAAIRARQSTHGSAALAYDLTFQRKPQDG